ncbi:venom serine carboxypeptidase-like [Atheta coriaria]|uniref:venom serine carboxypeptidase-like n=1 Tax=Dalotia coriaria TaxID=877792 RepID=UPI0031F3FBF8
MLNSNFSKTPVNETKGSMKGVYKVIILLVICLNTILVCINIALVVFKKSENSDNSAINGLYLTPHIKLGHIEDAQKMSRVHHPEFLYVDSYSGYLTADESTNSHLFFWYFPAAKVSTKTPLILWLNGGYGTSSLYGLFAEIGPFHPISSTELKLRQHSWHKQYNLLFIDNPVGVGYSRTQKGHTVNEAQAGRDLYTVMRQFYRLFPELMSNDFYIAGESYAGKYIPSLAYTIHMNNQKTKQKINFKGLIIGNGFIDPINQLNYADFLYQQGLVDKEEADELNATQNKCIDLISNKNYTEAFKVFSDIIYGDVDFTPYGSFFANFTGFSNYYNYLIPDDTNPIKLYTEQFLNKKDVKRALHVDEDEFLLNGNKVQRSEVMESAVTWLSELLSHYRVLLFAGQLDIIVGYHNVHNFIENMSFSGDDEFMKAPRVKWHVGDDLAGYCRSAGNITEIMVRNAGHAVPKDQPLFTLDMIDRFINNKTFN